MSTSPGRLPGLLQGLGAKKTLERERALAQLAAYIQPLTGNADVLEMVWHGLLGQINDPHAWESRLGGLLGAKALMEAGCSPAQHSTSAPLASVDGSSPQGHPLSTCTKDEIKNNINSNDNSSSNNRSTDGTSSTCANVGPFPRWACTLPAERLGALFEACMRLLEDDEPRVRVAVGEVLGGLARVLGPVVWLRAQPTVMASIREHYDREGEGEKCAPAAPTRTTTQGLGSARNAEGQQRSGAFEPGVMDSHGKKSDRVDNSCSSGIQNGGKEGAAAGSGFLNELLSTSYQPKVPGMGEMRHGTEGWRCLETSMRTMVAILDGAGSTVAPQVTPGLVNLVASSMHHPNRYVREAAHAGACALFRALAGATQHQQASEATAQADGTLARATLHQQTKEATAQADQASALQGEEVGSASRGLGVQEGGVLHPPASSNSDFLQQQQQQQQQQGLAQEHVGQQGQGVEQQPQQRQGERQQHMPIAGDEGQQGQEGHQKVQQKQQGQQHGQEGQQQGHLIEQLGQQQGEQEMLQGQQQASTAAAPGCCYSLLDLGMQLAPYIADGLTDNWSQVRRSACVSARTLLLLLLHIHHGFEPLMPVLLPPMCLNRYYMAEGVRSYAQDTWQMTMGGRGRLLVAQHIQQVADYYAAQSKAVHHGVREAACICIAELAEKVERTAVEPHMARLLHCMLLCFKDMAWPVRDAACVAGGRCVLCYPEVCKPRLQELLDLWCAHLWDNVQSVRENSARALADAMRGIPHGAPLDVVHQSIRELLPKAYEQPMDTRGRQPDRGSSRSTSRATPGAGSASPSSAASHPTQAKSSSSSGSRPRSFGRPRAASPSAGRPLSPARMMEQALKNDPMFCPSDEDMGLFGAGAAARFSTAFYIKGDGCMDFGFSRDQEPWEASDGAVFLVRELACVHPEACTQHLQPLVDLVAAAAMNNFEGAPKLRETVWRCLTTIARAIGKTALKRHLLEGMLGPLMDDLTCSTQLTEAAAGKAVGVLRDMLGPSIFMARLSPKQVSAMQASPHVPPPTVWTSSTLAPPSSGSAFGIPSILGPRLGLGHR